MVASFRGSTVFKTEREQVARGVTSRKATASSDAEPSLTRRPTQIIGPGPPTARSINTLRSLRSPTLPTNQPPPPLLRSSKRRKNQKKPRKEKSENPRESAIGGNKQALDREMEVSLQKEEESKLPPAAAVGGDSEEKETPEPRRYSIRSRFLSVLADRCSPFLSLLGF